MGGAGLKKIVQQQFGSSGFIHLDKKKTTNKPSKNVKKIYIILFTGHTVAAVQCQYRVEREVYEL